MNTRKYNRKNQPTALYAAFLALLLAAGIYAAGVINLEDPSLSGVGDKLSYLLAHPLSITFNSVTVKVELAMLVIWFLFVGYYQTHYRDFHLDIEHGSADWLDPFEAAKELADPDERYNRILSGNVKVSLRRGLANNNILLIGSSGDYKTTSIVEQNLLQLGSNYVMLDVKGDTQRKLGRYMESKGYKIYSLNLKEPSKSDRYNPFEYIEDENDLLRVIKALHTSLRPHIENSSGDPFWEDGMDLYLQALFYWTWLVEGKEKRRVPTMNDVLDLVQKETQTTGAMNARKRPQTVLERMMDDKAEEMGADYPPVRVYRQLKEGAEETVRSIVIMINAALSICNTAEVKRIFEANDINMREIGLGAGEDRESKVILFLIIPDNNPVYNFIISMFYTQMFDTLIRIADNECSGPLPIPVEVWMDEFYAGARPADTDKLLGTVRSRNISMIPVLQSISQIKTLYQNDKWETIMDNTACVIFLGSGPLASSTHKFVSEALGKATIDSRADSQTKSSQGSVGMNYSRTGRELMTPDEVKAMPPTDCIIFLKSRQPIYDEKAIPFDVPGAFTAQDWLKKRYSEALACGQYAHPVHAFYDEKNLRYITVDYKPRFQIVTNPKEIEKWEKMARTNPYIYMMAVPAPGAGDFAYVNFSDAVYDPERARELFEAVRPEYEKYPQDENILPVITDVIDEDYWDRKESEGIDRSGWSAGTRDEAVRKYFSLLPRAEQELVYEAFQEDFSEEEWAAFIIGPYSMKMDFLAEKGIASPAPAHAGAAEDRKESEHGRT